MDKKNGVKAEERQEIMKEFRKILFVDQIENFEEMFKIFLTRINHYQSLSVYFNALQKTQQDWALCYRDFFIRGNNTNNLCERAFLRLKDSVLNRVKCSNVVHLAEYVTKVMTAEYQSEVFKRISYDSIPTKVKKMYEKI